MFVLVDSIFKVPLQVSDSPIDDYAKFLKENKWARGSTGNRYSETHSKDFVDYMTWLRISIGRKATLNYCANATGPSKSTIERNKYELFPKMQLGVIYIDRYRDWVTSNGYTNVTHIASDATATETKVQYDSATGTIIGFVPKLNPITGMPSEKSFVADSPSNVLSFFEDSKYKKADNVILILATPLQHNAPSFPVAIFPTDNKYTSETAYNRCGYVSDVFESENFEVVCSSTDADAKEKGGAKIQTGFGHVKTVYDTDFIYDPSINRISTIDTVHIVNSLKMKMFNTTRILYAGDHPVLVADLQLLVSSSKYSKEDHRLNFSDVNNNDKTMDKMNKQATAKICAWPVIEILEEMGALGTAFYLKIMRILLDVFQDVSMPDDKRLYDMAYVNETLLRWRANVEDTGGIGQDFITSSTWESIVLNYAAVVKFVGEGRGSLVTKLHTQNCEQTFGQMRSQASAGQFGVNFTVKQAAEILTNAHIKQVVENKLSRRFNFPSVSKKRAEPFISDVPLTPEEMTQIISDAKESSKADCVKLGMDENSRASIGQYMFPPKFDASKLRENVIAYQDDQEIQEGTRSDDENLSDDENMNQVDGSSSGVDESEDDNRKVITIKKLHFIDEKTDGNNFTIVRSPTQQSETAQVRKSYLVYLLDDRNKKKSYDRAQRVQASGRKELIISGRPHGAMTWRSTGLEMGNYVAVKCKDKVSVGRVCNIRYKNGRKMSEKSFPYRNIIFSKNENVEFNLHPHFEVASSGIVEKKTNKSYFTPNDYTFTLIEDGIDMKNNKLKFNFNLVR